MRADNFQRRHVAAAIAATMWAITHISSVAAQQPAAPAKPGDKAEDAKPRKISVRTAPTFEPSAN